MRWIRSVARTTTALAGLLLSPLTPSLNAQQQLPPLTEEVELRVVNVDVVVVDRKGEPIRGLTRDDFELFEDGKQVEITNFFTYAEADASAPKGQGRTESESGAAETGQSQEPLVLAIYVDENNVPPPARQRILQDLEGVLKGWTKGSEQFVYLRRANGLRVEAGPTWDPQQVLEALSKNVATSRGFESQLEYQRALAAVESEYVACAMAGVCNPCTDRFESFVALARRYAEEQQARLEQASFAAADAIRVLAGVPGRKALLYITEALPQQPGLVMFNMLGQICPERVREGDQYALEFDETRRLNHLAAHANASRVVLYPLDAGGLRNYSANDASGPSFGSGGSPNDDPLPNFFPSPRIDTLRIANLQNSLFQLGDETGGNAILNANRPAADLLRMRDDLLSTYSLGFVPGHGHTGRIHLLDVKLKGGRKARLRYRKSYRDKVESELLGERLLSKLYLASTDQATTADNRLGVSLSIGEARRLDRRRDTLPVEIRLPLSSLTVLPGGDAQAPVARIRVWMTALGSRGHLPLREELIEFTADDVRLEDDFLSFVVDIDLRREKQTLGVGLRDEISGEESLAVVEMEFDASS